VNRLKRLKLVTTIPAAYLAKSTERKTGEGFTQDLLRKGEGVLCSRSERGLVGGKLIPSINWSACTRRKAI
jgi:hypothetical protein